MSPVRRYVLVFGGIAVIGIVCSYARDFSFSPFMGPSWTHPMGTDHLGRDLLSEITCATIYSFGASLLASCLAMALGLIIGLLSTLWPGDLVRRALIAVREAEWSISGLFLALAVALLVGGGEAVVVAVLVLIQWPVYAEVSDTRAREIWRNHYVDAERALGASRLWVLTHTIFPDVFHTCAYILPSRVVEAWVVELALNYLGLGFQPGSPSLGRMLMLATSRKLSGGLTDIAVMIGVCLVGTMLGLWALSHQLQFNEKGGGRDGV